VTQVTANLERLLAQAVQKAKAADALEKENQRLKAERLR
jgi:hypothetical protein